MPPESACVDGVQAVRMHEGKATALTDVVTAFRGLSSGDAIRVCGGTWEVAETLTAKGIDGLSISALDGFLIGPAGASLLRISDARGLRIDGISFARDGADDAHAAEAEPLVELTNVSGLALSSARFDAAKGPALRLTGVADAALDSLTVLNAFVGFDVRASSALTFSNLRLLEVVEAATAPDEKKRVLSAAISAPGAAPVEAPIAAVPAPDPATLPDWKALAAAFTMHAVVTWESQPYLFLSHTRGWPANAPKPENENDGVKHYAPLPAPRKEATRLMPPGRLLDVSVFNASGACRPKLGAPVYVDTSGCEPSFLLALPLEGCGPTLAPVALAPRKFQTRPAPWFQWRPLVQTSAKDAAAALALAPFPPIRTFVDEGIKHIAGAFPVLLDAPSHSFVRWDVAGDRESLVAILFGYQYPVESCGTIEHSVRGAFRTAGTGPAVPFELPAGLLRERPLAGALFLEGQVAALIGRNPVDVAGFGRTAAGGFAEIFSFDVYSDNDECLGFGTSVDFEGPCAP